MTTIMVLPSWLNHIEVLRRNLSLVKNDVKKIVPCR